MSDPLTPPPGSLAVHALRIAAGQTTPRRELLAEETAIAFSYNGISQAVMMASPQDLEDFALGFSLSEGILTRPGELLDLEIQPQAEGIVLEMQISAARFAALKNRRRSLTGNSGCGLCGHDSLASAIRALPALHTEQYSTAAQVHAAMQALAAQQALNAATGAVHAAGRWQYGQLLLREDVGRHNALDKLIGACARQPEPHGLLVISSRASYEMVHKAASAGFAILAAISAPTALAVQLAEETGLCLIGFAREQRLTVYSHPERLRAS
ncbi:formate dehydrogenase accessory sulfurtransferase FdhD [Chitinimonas taiwanensis]|uniref:Sulfur carrier protein FdhD n=1 Tax=Chitinimonas taiwanensis DSM 18899 TaxID=1121279 RepID=A0A1K2HR87_9NEIS|nr:formate dehydrogenase accessory sulfurtransferase FdhD [Chitinimonas taiwanensis]SFZ78778.1 FdhD protein [Chitinimonas taiwanensis DSM 18899]